MNDEFNLLLIGIGIVVFLCVAVIVGVAGSEAYSCHSKAEKQGLECEWGIFQGCMVKMPSGNWMDYDRLRYMN